MLLFCDSFDHYLTADITQKYSSNASGTISAANGRNSSSSLRWTSPSGTNLVMRAVAVSGTTITVGFATKINSLANQGQFFGFGESAGPHILLRVNTDGSLAVCLSNGTSVALNTVASTLGTTAAGVVTAGSYLHIQLSVTVHDSAGAYELRINGSTTPALSGSGVDTRNAGSGIITWVALGNSISGLAQLDFDDFWVTDASGTDNTGFLGDCRVEAKVASSGNGTNVGWTCSTGADHGALVDETTPNSDTDYNSTSTVGVKDTYNFADLSSAGSVRGVQIVTSAKKTDTGTRSICHVTRSDGADYDGSNLVLSTAYLYHTSIRELDPDTGVAWLVAGINSAEFGQKLTV